jgi:pyrroloquinoline quinone biosynthesis protein D
MSPAPLSLQARPKLSARARVQVDPISHGPVLLYPEGILELNETAHEIATRCTGEKTIGEIADALAAEYEAPRAELLPDLLACLEDLQRRQLITLSAE